MGIDSEGTRLKDEEESIYQVIAATLLAGRLAPGTQLVEMRLAALFGVSRERIRKVLQRLGHERLLEMIPNRGAFVASPNLAQAREIYEARRIVEGGIVGRLAGRLTAAQAQDLAQHGKRELEALRRDDRVMSIRLSGEFHVLLAEATGSPFVIRQLQELVSRTSMLVAFFEPAAASSCGCEEHGEISGALIAGDAARAIRAMHAHLSLIETRLTPRDEPREPGDPEVELKRAWAALQKKPGASRRSRKAA
jgi:DNA-binding GntR family transcriptional regulator